MNANNLNHHHNLAGTYGGNGGGQAGAVRQPSPVMIAQKSLDEAATSLHGIIAELEGRLQPLLAPVPENAAKTGYAVPNTGSVAGQITASAGVVQGAYSRLQDIIARLEI